MRAVHKGMVTTVPWKASNTDLGQDSSETDWRVSGLGAGRKQTGAIALRFLGKLLGHNIVNGIGRLWHRGKWVKSQYLPHYLKFGNIFCPADLIDNFVGFVVPTKEGGLDCLGYVTREDIEAQPIDHSRNWPIPTVVFELSQLRDIKEII